MGKIIEKSAITGFSFEPFEMAIKAISPYMLDFKEDLKADTITSESKDESTGKSSAKKEQDASNQENAKELEIASKLGVESKFKAGFKLVNAGGGAKAEVSASLKTKESSKMSAERMRDISEQLSNSIKWEKKGETVIPKEIDVVKLSRMKFQTGFSISISKRYTLNAPFHRTFELYTKDIEILAGLLEPLQLLKKLNQTSSKIAELEKNFNEKLKFSLEAEEKR